MNGLVDCWIDDMDNLRLVVVVAVVLRQIEQWREVQLATNNSAMLQARLQSE